VCSSDLKCKARIITHNIGSACSCGSLILSFGNLIHVNPLSITMFHNSAGGGYDSSHRMLTKAQHVIARVAVLFEMMKSRGIITEEEVNGITKSGKEYFLNSDEMTRRLKENNIWYEGE
jgi:ATP-dependent protease ClpP protease subunit